MRWQYGDSKICGKVWGLASNVKMLSEIEGKRSLLDIWCGKYAFTEKDLKTQIDIPVYTHNTDKNQLKYVMHYGKKLFFPNQDDNAVRHQYTQLIMEQDELSPHKYFSEGFQFPQRGGGFL